ncbi:hypothetical protein E2542_SST29337 [Spatholobus suberectus]|nr:hypothetical protein E2542_SST29337 [Spatholobus suberectus]
MTEKKWKKTWTALLRAWYNFTGTVSLVTVMLRLLVEAPKTNDIILFYKAAFGIKEFGLVDDSASPTKARENGVVFCLETEDVERAITKVVKACAMVGTWGRCRFHTNLLWLFYSPEKKCADAEA